jgi:hypothetical protein
MRLIGLAVVLALGVCILRIGSCACKRSRARSVSGTCLLEELTASGVERAAQRRPWRMSHQRRLSSPPASALPDRYADAVTTSSSAPSRAGEWDSHQCTSRISWLGSASDSQPGQ